jgi:DNA-dependent protein kinase catalytic subunit
MVHVLTALRRQRTTLLTVMDVFVKEPHLDWVHRAARANRGARPAESGGPEAVAMAGQVGGRGGGGGGGGGAGGGGKAGGDQRLAWYPLQRIRIARDKLQGRHPSEVMLEELKENPAFKGDYEKCCRRIIVGLKGAPRARVRDRSVLLSVAEQVEFIVDQSTDPNILARTWEGWLPLV